jgi:hypothetical protein
MWFLPFSVAVRGARVIVPGYQIWFVKFIQKLLQADRNTLKLIRSSPFANEKPTFIRARYYLYEFTSVKEKKETAAWWNRTLIGDYLPPVRMADLQTGSTEIEHEIY